MVKAPLDVPVFGVFANLLCMADIKTSKKSHLIKNEYNIIMAMNQVKTFEGKKFFLMENFQYSAWWQIESNFKALHIDKHIGSGVYQLTFIFDDSKGSYVELFTMTCGNLNSGKTMTWNVDEMPTRILNILKGAQN